MKQDIELLNELFKEIFHYGWKVGACWNSDKYNELCDINGYFKDDIAQDKRLREVVESLLTLLGKDPSQFVIYTKEDCSIHENDWDYIAPLVEIKK